MKSPAQTLRWLATLSLVLAATACTGDFSVEPTPFGDVGGSSGPDAGVGGGGNGIDGAAYFRTNILPILSSPRPKGACALCHQGNNAANGPDFMGLTAENNYSGILNGPGLIGATPAQSRFYTRGDHAGNAFLPEELTLIEVWIASEN